MKRILFIFLLVSFLVSCTEKRYDVSAIKEEQENIMDRINESTINHVISLLIEKYGDDNKFRIERGVRQTAALWKFEDGSEDIFTEFCQDNFIRNDVELNNLFLRLSENFEILNGNYNKIIVDLNRPLHLTTYEKYPIDKLFGAFNPSAHNNEDFFKNKIAFHILLNFPHYSLKEKTELGKNWTRKQWAYVRMGDSYISRIPGDLLQKKSEAMTNADSYISEYNICMDKLINEKGKTFFPEGLKLITHWGLRDELKSNYANKDEGLLKQKMIYEVMKHIIKQDIPESVINNNEYTWNPFNNQVFRNGEKVVTTPEPNTRYQHILNNFHSVRAIDEFSPSYPSYISRKFDQEFEIPQEVVEKLFVDFVSSPLVKQVAEIIKNRLDRDLEPFDIWYDGFKARSSISEEDLNKITMGRFSNPQAFKNELPTILNKLGFNKEKAAFICSKIVVDPSRGAGHAWGAQMKSDNAHLRTRISKKGMDYKGYNIAIHEFGHNVEQTLTLHDVDYYMLNGVPNTAFTEAWAFIFQKRDLELLGMKEDNPDKETLEILDNFWSIFEIMGVSLVDMNLWKWLYENPNATAEQTKEQTIIIAKNIWNKYFAAAFGIKDQPILAIYSHMIDYPLYLSAYPIGHLIEFQLESYMKGKNLAKEMIRICKQGKIIPQEWLKGAVGKKLSIEPTLKATEVAIKKIR